MHLTHPILARVFARCTRMFAVGAGMLVVLAGVLGVDASSVAHAATAHAPAPAVRAQPQPVRIAAGTVRTQGQTADPSTDPSANSTLPPGPRIEPEESEQATQDRAQQKAIMAAVAIGLLVIVVLGRRQRNKHRPGKK